MAITQDDTIVELQRANAELRRERDAAVAREAVIDADSVRRLGELRQRAQDLDEALEYQSAVSDVLKVINRSAFGLNTVLQTVLTSAVHLCRADRAILYRFRDGRCHFEVGHNNRREYEALERSAPIAAGPDTVVGRAMQEGRAAQILDAMRDPEYGPKDQAQINSARSMLGVPLLRSGELIGVLALARTVVEAFTERQIELVATFADQAVIAIENARLITEQREALEQQTAMAELLQAINASPGNLAPVFDTVLERAMRLCGAAFGLLYTYDGEHFHIGAARGVPAAFADFRAKNPSVIPPGGNLAKMLETKRPVHINDYRDEAAYKGGTPGGRAIVDLGGARTVLFVPLIKDQGVVGWIAIYRQEVRAFSDKQIALLESFAAQSVIAMENARLLTQQREALEQQTATAEVLQVINASPGNLAPVFETMLEKAMRLCGAAFGILFIHDSETVEIFASRDVPANYLDFVRRHPPRSDDVSNHARAMREQAVLNITDLRQSAPFVDRVPYALAAVEQGGVRSLLLVPLVKEVNSVGIIALFRQEVLPFTDRQVAVLRNFAAQAVIAMENARLLDEIRQRQEELRVTFENMGDGVAMFDETQHLVAWNGKFQEIFNLPDALLEPHRTYEDYLRFLAARGDFGPGVDTVEQITELVASTGQPYGYERTRPDGRVIETRRNPVPDGGFVFIYSDITERKRSEEETRAARDAAETALRELRTAQANLIQAEKMASLGQLTAGIAHEIKNPLNFVNNFSALSTELIDELRDVLAPEPLGDTARTEVDDLTALLKGNLEKVVQHGQRADGIVRSMLDHSRGSSGERRMVDLNALIDEALNLAYHGARAQDQSFNITLERDFGAGIAPIEVNPQDMTRVFLNIFSNGFYATTKRARERGDAGFAPTLKVTTTDAGEAVEIHVRDNGTGIPADIRDKLFQPFFTTKPTGEGTGLGLSIAYDIITQQHGGTVTVDSEVGEYSEFTIRLPRNP